jgi:hypothetical protein
VNDPVRYCGRTFTENDIRTICDIIDEDPTRSRYRISRLVCEAIDWHKPNGTLKDMSCRVALLRMHREGLIQLPPPRRGHPNQHPYTRRTREAEPGPPIREPVSALGDLRLHRVRTKGESHLWNEYIERYHYLGYTKLPGAQLRYLATAREQVVALAGFGAAAWKTAARDHFIGWSAEQRARRLHLVLNNSRFLILPWIRSPNLASYLLATLARRLPDEWNDTYAYRPVLLETFVDTSRFRGTCYKAANWIYLGKTTGRGKLDVEHLAARSVKSVWVYPLDTAFRSVLCV